MRSRHLSLIHDTKSFVERNWWNQHPCRNLSNLPVSFCLLRIHEWPVLPCAYSPYHARGIFLVCSNAKSSSSPSSTTSQTHWPSTTLSAIILHCTYLLSLDSEAMQATKISHGLIKKAESDKSSSILFNQRFEHQLWVVLVGEFKDWENQWIKISEIT